MIIKAKIDVSKIDKNRLFKGSKGTYLDASLLTNRDGSTDQYGNDGMIVQDVSQEERKQGVKGAIIGNFKIINRDQSKPKPTSKVPDAADVEAGVSDDVPF